MDHGKTIMGVKLSAMDYRPWTMDKKP